MDLAVKDMSCCVVRTMIMMNHLQKEHLKYFLHSHSHKMLIPIDSEEDVDSGEVTHTASGRDNDHDNI